MIHRTPWVHRAAACTSCGDRNLFLARDQRVPVPRGHHDEVTTLPGGFDPDDKIRRERGKIEEATDPERTKPAEYTGDDPPAPKMIEDEPWFKTEGPLRKTGWIGDEKKFIGDADGVPLFTFGKHEEEPAEEHPDYLRWMLTEDFDGQTKKIIRRILDGIGEEH